MPTLLNGVDQADQLIVPCPAPRSPLFDDFGKARQNGITDPRWPGAFDEFLQRVREVENGTPKELRRAIGDRAWERFRAEYEDKMAWRMRSQECMSIVTADVMTTSLSRRERRRLLAEVLRRLTCFAWDQMRKTPDRYSVRPNDYVWIPTSYRVTITLGLGSSLFVSSAGDNRFGLADWKPQSLRVMPSYKEADDADFEPERHATDLVVLVQSDHPYVNSAIVRRLPHEIHPKFKLQRVEHGFSRPDTREWLGFNDGVANIKGHDAIEQMVYVSEADDEPEWCRSGSYMVYRKIREDLSQWHQIPRELQERMIGRRKDLRGTPLNPDPANPETHLYHPSGSNQGTPLTAHSFKANPRRPEPDLFGVRDSDRNILRRGFPYFQGLRHDGQLEVGLQFLAFMKDLRAQFEWRVEAWQLNPHFPYPNTGIDRMFALRILQTEAGGFFFCPPAPRPPVDPAEWAPGDDFFARALLEISET